MHHRWACWRLRLRGLCGAKEGALLTHYVGLDVSLKLTAIWAGPCRGENSGPKPELENRIVVPDTKTYNKLAAKERHPAAPPYDDSLHKIPILCAVSSGCVSHANEHKILDQW
jgi:hypothetical protein